MKLSTFGARSYINNEVNPIVDIYIHLRLRVSRCYDRDCQGKENLPNMMSSCGLIFLYVIFQMTEREFILRTKITVNI